MTTEQAAKYAEKINSESVKNAIKKTISNALGVTVDDVVARPIFSNFHGWYIDIEIIGDNTTVLLRSSKLLCAMFKSARLRLKFWLPRKDTPTLMGFSVGIGYTHPEGGANGLSSLLDFAIDEENNFVKIFQNETR